MKKMLMVGAILLAAVVSNAASASSVYSRGSNNITGLLGFTKAAVNFGVNYEHRVDTIGFGGYFHYSSEKKDNFANNQITSFGGIAPIHFLDDAHMDTYLAPGFGVHMIKGLGAQDDVTTFGPLWKLGALFKISNNVKVGLERTELVNWFTDKATADAVYTNAALSFAF
jgi:hypothetical protein